MRVPVPPSPQDLSAPAECGPETREPPAPAWAPAVRISRERRLDGLADCVEDAADLGAQEDQRDDRDDRDEREDQRVLGEALAFVVVANRRDECIKLRHWVSYLLSWRVAARPRGVGTLSAVKGRVKAFGKSLVHREDGLRRMETKDRRHPSRYRRSGLRERRSDGL